MENERANLHELKLADMREQLREANRTIALLRESEKEKDKLSEKVKDRDLDVAKAVKEAVEEEKKKAKRIIAKQDLLIKALEKQLIDEKNARTEHEKASGSAKKNLTEVEGKYRFEMSLAAEQFEAERQRMNDEYKKLEESFAAIIADKENETTAAITKANRDKEELVEKVTKQQIKALTELKSSQREVIAEKDKHTTVITTRLEEANSRIAALDKNISDMMAERQKDFKNYADASQTLESRFRDEMVIKDKSHSEELDRIYERVKNAIAKKDDVILHLKAELALSQKKLHDMSQL